MWFKVDDQLWSHPKWLAAPLVARGLWVAAGSWARFYENSGEIPLAAVKLLGFTKAHAEALVKCGLFEKTDEGYLIHDFADYNPTKEQIEKKRAGGAVRVANHRAKKKQEESVTGPECNTPCNAVTDPVTETVTGPECNTEGNGVTPEYIPIPHNPVVTEVTTTPIAPKGAYSTEFLDFWVAFPSERKAAKPQCAKKFTAAVKAGTPAEAIIQAAQRYRDDPNRSAQFTVSPLTWLNQERWNAGPLPPRDDGPRFTSSQLALAADMQAALNRTNPPPQPQIGENPWD